NKHSFYKFNKCSECVHLKKLCLLFFSFLVMNIAQLLKIHEKIEKEQITFFNKKQHLFEAFQAAEIKKHQLHHHCYRDDSILLLNQRVNSSIVNQAQVITISQTCL